MGMNEYSSRRWAWGTLGQPSKLGTNWVHWVSSSSSEMVPEGFWPCWKCLCRRVWTVLENSLITWMSFSKITRLWKNAAYCDRSWALRVPENAHIPQTALFLSEITCEGSSFFPSFSPCRMEERGRRGGFLIVFPHRPDPNVQASSWHVYFTCTHMFTGQTAVSIKRGSDLKGVSEQGGDGTISQSLKKKMFHNKTRI